MLYTHNTTNVLLYLHVATQGLEIKMSIKSKTLLTSIQPKLSLKIVEKKNKEGKHMLLVIKL